MSDKISAYRKEIIALQMAGLVVKKINGQLTVDEAARLEKWLSESPEFRRAYQDVIRTHEHMNEATGITMFDEQAALARFIQKHQAAQTIGRAGLYQRMIGVAAVLLVAVAVAIYFFVTPQPRQNEFRSGGNRATLTLADGRMVNLREDQGSIIIGDEIMYSDGTEVADLRTDMKSEGAPTSHVSHVMSLTTPKGGIYQVTLPDGTNVWLNSATTLKYPLRFTDTIREVELSGEAYFSVKQQTADRKQPMEKGLRSPVSRFSSSKIPFIVRVHNKSITVLGTEFNVFAYPEEPATVTTLVSGSVKVGLLSETGDPASILLRPGKEAISTGSSIISRDADLSAATAWKSGVFDFHGKDLRRVMRELARWYDLEVIYNEPIPEMKFLGKIYRSNDLATVLEILRESKVHFRVVNGRTLILDGKP